MATLEEILKGLSSSDPYAQDGSTHNLTGGAGGVGDAQAIAQLMLGGGSASVDGRQLFGSPIGPRGDMGPGVLSPGALDTAGRATGGMQLRPAQTVTPEQQHNPLRPGLREILDSADEIARPLMGGKSDKTLVANPYGPGSYDPNDQAAVAQVKAQGAQASKVAETQRLIQSVSSNPLLKGSQGEIVKQLLMSMGAIKSPEQEAFDKAKGTASGKIAGGGGTASKLDEVLSVEDSGKLGVPYGTTKRQAAEQGLYSMTAVQRNTITEIGKARSVAEKLGGLAERLAEKYGASEGMFNRLGQGLANKKAMLDQDDPDLLEYSRLKEAFLTNIARSVGSEKGNLAKEDVERARGFFANLDSWTPDTKKGIKRMTEGLSTFLEEAEHTATGGRLKPAAEQSKGIPPGSKPTGRTYKGKPVFQGPDGKLHVED